MTKPPSATDATHPPELPIANPGRRYFTIERWIRAILIVVEVGLILAIIGLLIATWMPAFVGATSKPAGR